MTVHIMIVTGEASGDLHGANLLRALQRKIPDIKASGMGGVELSTLGMELLYDAAKVSVVGIFEVLAHAKDIFIAQRTLRNWLEKNKPDLLILIDLPDFNFLLAKKAKQLNIPVFYYIAPQVWGWREGRVKTIRQRVDTLGVILPFEEEFFTRHHVHAKYVGHPLLDTIIGSANKRAFYSEQNLHEDTRCIGLFPGSRKKEVMAQLPIFLEAGKILQTKCSEKLCFLIPQASTISLQVLEAAGILEAQKTIDIRIIQDRRYDLMAACTAVAAVSGTVTLELAILQVPMVVTYKLSSLTYFVGKLLVNLEFFSLPNLIAGFGAVPELLQGQVTAARVAEELYSLIYDVERRNTMLSSLKSIKQKLGEPGASEKAAEAALQLLDR